MRSFFINRIVLGNGRLKAMTYANGHTMKAVYNSIGQMVAEKWFETEAQAADPEAAPLHTTNMCMTMREMSSVLLISQEKRV